MERRFSRLGLVSMAALAVAGSGCVVEGDFDPLGTSVSLSGTWQIQPAGADAAQPADADTCAAAGIAEVQLVFYEEGSDERFTDPRFRWACEVGHFDTRDLEQPKVLAHGRYDIQWLAYAGDGTQVAEGPKILLDVSDPSLDHQEVSGPVFRPANLTVDLTYQVAPGGDQGSCGDAMVDTITWSLEDSEGTAVATGDGACVSSLGFAVGAGTYSLVVTGESDTDSWGATCTGIEVTDPTATTTFACDVPIEGETPPEMGTVEMQLGWQVSAGGEFADCATAGVTEMSWSLNDGDGAEVAGATEACMDTVSIPDVPFGTYSFTATGSNDSATWATTCTGVVVDGAMVTYSCDVMME